MVYAVLYRSGKLGDFIFGGVFEQWDIRLDLPNDTFQVNDDLFTNPR